MRLQVALDFTSIERAVKLARVLEDVPIIEVGTPLIKYNGMSAVSILKEACPRKTIVADMKTADLGFLESVMAFQSGADITTVLASASIQTIKEACKAAEEYGGEVMLDFISIPNLDEKVKEILETTSPDYVLFHIGIDDQKRGMKLDIPPSIEDYQIPVAIAGGLTPSKIKELKKSGKIDIVIIGKYISQSKDPICASREVLKVLDDGVQK